LAYFDGLTERQIAARLGKSVKQVRRLLRLAFADLRDRLGEASDDGAESIH
jgi:DNA-directed RNA polymerase specialized sigma24 family protein